MKRIVFDAHPILKWVQKERGYQKVKSLLIDCRNQSALGYINQINLGEVYYKTIRAVHSISYADCFAAATALRYEATILTGDPEFKKIESLVSIEWL
jgi:ribonuclease VapC